MTLFERLMMALQSGRDFRVVMRTIFKKFSPNEPLDYGFETHATDPETLEHVSVNVQNVLDCGHVYAGEFIQCSCKKNFCPSCGEDLKHCHVCNGPLICGDCRRYSHISGDWYCRAHRYYWILGR